MRLLTENEDTRTALESEDNLIRFASSESIHRNVDTFLESFDSDYQIFLYNTANDRMYRPTELYGQLTKVSGGPYRKKCFVPVCVPSGLLLILMHGL